MAAAAGQSSANSKTDSRGVNTAAASGRDVSDLEAKFCREDFQLQDYLEPLWRSWLTTMATSSPQVPLAVATAGVVVGASIHPATSFGTILVSMETEMNKLSNLERMLEEKERWASTELRNWNANVFNRLIQKTTDAIDVCIYHY